MLLSSNMAPNASGQLLNSYSVVEERYGTNTSALSVLSSLSLL